MQQTTNDLAAGAVAMLRLALSTDEGRELLRNVVEIRDEVVDDDPWMDVEAAAAYLCCKPKRLYDLRGQGRVQFAKESQRLLFRRSWLDAIVEDVEGRVAA